MLRQAINLMSSFGAPVNEGWNPADKHAEITLSGSNKIAEMLNGSAADFRSVRAAQSKSSGVLYFEVALAAAYSSGTAASLAAGVCDSAMQLTGDPIFGALSGNRAHTRANGQYGNQGGHVGSLSTSFSTNGAHTLGLVADFSTRTLTFYFDGVNAGSTTWASGSAAMYPSCSIGAGSSASGGWTLRLTAAEFAQSIPPGASAWAG